MSGNAASKTEGAPRLTLRYEPSEIARFGHRLARLTLGQDVASAAEIVRLCEDEAVEMLTLRVATDRLGLVQDLEAHGFRLMDCLVYYEASTNGRPATGSAAGSIRLAGKADAAEVGRIARACFSDFYGHYHADPRLDRRAIADGYVEWAERSCAVDGVADAVFLAVVDGKGAGFATMRSNGREEGEGVLFAVHPDFAGSGLHGALLERGLQWCAEQAHERMIISTQLYNLRTQRSYSNRGFRLFQSFYTFHRWFI